jgi:DNA-3-methyladenine glycosylase II
MDHVIHLAKDRKLKAVIQKQNPVKLIRRKKIHLYLCGSIMSQQLSTKVASVIHKRFMNLFEGEPGPEDILAIPLETLRAIGLSHAKTNYVHNVARFSIEKGTNFNRLSKMANDEVIEYISQIKGVGRWTAEMLLMFALGREDIFSIDDLGIQNAMRKIYKLDGLEKKEFREALQRISEKWSPFRTYACMYLWRWKDISPGK